MPQEIQCELCPHHCNIKNGGAGLCKVRFHNNGKIELPLYGRITALACDPIEKKPLYHFRPGSQILSAGFAGCNMRCPFCQNWHISQNTSADSREISPRELMSLAKSNCAETDRAAIAYTYSEPLVHYEFLLECMGIARNAGIANVLVTNGCLNASHAEKILKLTDAANIDLKSFSGDTYKKILGGDLDAVTDFIRMACAAGVHTELTTLVVPGLNDSEAELDAGIDFIAGLDIYGFPPPWHLSAYHPGWKWNTPATSASLLLKTTDRAKGRLRFVYTGNVTGEINDTFCVNCENAVISRRGYRVDLCGLIQKNNNGKTVYSCASCGKAISFFA